ncbi:MAG TPA: PAS-domain containing protein [Rhizomicrobium sp.]|nr:PAS-domain containing protein [Rhizomicrobium sp.]
MQSAQAAKFREENDSESAAPELVEALHCLRVAVTVFDANERLVFCNTHLNYLFRSLPSREELVGISYEELIRLEVAGGEIAAHESADLSALIARRRAQLREGEYRPLDVALADGRIVEIKARRTKEGGWIALWSDVTQARHSQSRLEDAVSLSADAFAFFDHADRLAMCNDSYASFYGFPAAAPAIGLQFAELIERATVNALLVRTDDTTAWRAQRLAVHRAAAGVMTVELAGGQAYLMRDRPTAEGGRVVVFTDVTDRRRVEQALEEQTKALAQSRSEAAAQASYLADLTRRFDEAAASADTTKTTLMRTMSHELKTPLNAIIGFSDLMLSMADRFGPDQVKEYAALIHEGGRNLLRLINQILDLTKLSAGRYELRRSRLDAGAMLWAAYGAFETRAREKDIALDAGGAPVGLMVDADENALQGMIFQLVDNAVSFTPEGGAVALAAVREGDRVLLSVTDNGPGVAKDDIARILRPFEQGGRGTTDHTGGAGLGLTLVKAFAEAHGGSFAIESARGEGFTATIALPAA